jgi:TonB family protein
VVALPEKDQGLKPPAAAPAPAPVSEKEAPVTPPPVEKPLPKPKPKPEAKKVFSEKKKPLPDKKEVKEEQNSALARLRAMQKLKEMQKAKAATESQNSDFKGNQLSSGNSLSGLEKLHHNNYLDELDGHIRTHWNLPEWLANGNFKASVILRIDKRGSIIDKKFVMRSGNELFDQQVMGTLEKANPLPPPPEDLVQFYSSRGVEIRFPE